MSVLSYICPICMLSISDILIYPPGLSYPFQAEPNDRGQLAWNMAFLPGSCVMPLSLVEGMKGGRLPWIYHLVILGPSIYGRLYIQFTLYGLVVGCVLASKGLISGGLKEWTNSRLETLLD